MYRIKKNCSYFKCLLVIELTYFKIAEIIFVHCERFSLPRGEDIYPFSSLRYGQTYYIFNSFKGENINNSILNFQHNYFRHGFVNFFVSKKKQGNRLTINSTYCLYEKFEQDQ